MRRAALVPEVLSGLASMLVVLPASIAFGVLSYAALGPSYAAVGALAGIFGSVATGIVAPMSAHHGTKVKATQTPEAE